MKKLSAFILGGVVVFCLMRLPFLRVPLGETVFEFSFSDDPNDVAEKSTPVDTSAASPVAGVDLAKYRDMYANDTCKLRKAMYDQALLALDSVHAISDDPRVDSVWKLLRPRLVYVNLEFARSVKSDDWHSTDDVIFLLPLLDGEELDTSSPFYAANALGVSNSQITNISSPRTPGSSHVEAYSVRIPKWRSITLFHCDKLAFKGFATVVYHEGYHTLQSEKATHDEGRDEDHPTIANLTSSIIESFMAKDQSFRVAVDSIDAYIATGDTVVTITNTDKLAPLYMALEGNGSGNVENDLSFLKLYYQKKGRRTMTPQMNFEGYRQCYKNQIQEEGVITFL